MKLHLFYCFNLISFLKPLLALKTQTFYPHPLAAPIFVDDPGNQVFLGNSLTTFDQKLLESDVSNNVKFDNAKDENITSINSRATSDNTVTGTSDSIVPKKNDTNSTVPTDSSSTGSGTKTETSLRGTSDTKSSNDAATTADGTDPVQSIVDSDLHGKGRSQADPNKSGYSKSSSSKDGDSSRIQTQKIASQNPIQNEGMDAQTFDRLFFLILITFVIIMGFFLRSFRICRKEAKEKHKKAQRPPVDFRRRDD